MAAQGQPELIVGVDFGMSQTGIAYCIAPWTNPITFQSWSNITAEVYNKTPSRLSYSQETGAIKDWGIFVDIEDRSADVREFFKLQLDPEYRSDFQDITHEDAKRFYRDYLTCLHDHVARFFQSRFPQWVTMHVEWNFSVPTTWKNAGVVRVLQDTIRVAGFGQDGRNHTCRVTLTEAEAAAISGAMQLFKRGDVILVCDAGGGTTDVNIMKVKSDPGEPIELDQMIQVEGQPIGSALIDIQVQQHLAERLSHVQHLLPATPEQTAERMMLGKFERFKCGFGTPGMSVPKILLLVHGLPPGSDYPLAGIRDSHIELSQATIKPIFDEQVESMIALIEEQLHSLQRVRPGEQVSYLIVSGGFGSSEYVQSRLTSYFERGRGAAVPNARNMRLIIADRPQLAVVLGLVKHRAQQIGQSITPIGRRCAPVSYGVVVNQRWNPTKHLGQRVVRDERDKKRWAIDQIEWLIRKGDVVTDDGVARKFSAKLRPAQLRRPWKAHFVMSTESVDNLPKSMAERDLLRDLCIVAVDLSQVHRVVYNQHWWNSGPRYELVHFAVRLIPGHADLRFRLLNGNTLLNSEEDRVEVTWGVDRVNSVKGVNELDQLCAE